MRQVGDDRTGDLLAQLTPLELGHAAAQLAADHAEREEPGWKELAFEAFVKYGRVASEFTTEDVRIANPRLPPAPDSRAWGYVAARAKREGMIVYVRHVRAVARGVHGMSIKLWRWVG